MKSLYSFLTSINNRPRALLFCIVLMLAIVGQTCLLNLGIEVGQAVEKLLNENDLKTESRIDFPKLFPIQDSAKLDSLTSKYKINESK